MRARDKPLVAMLRDPAHAPLVDTLEAYLDRAGDAKATAEALSLHRATLYYRLNRIEEITGDVLTTLDRFQADQRRFDLVICDPPTFSHAQGTGSTFSVTSDTNTFTSAMPGVTITVGKQSVGTEVTIDNEQYLILRESDVLAVLS